MRPSRPLVAVVLALVAVVAAGCTAEAKSTDTPSPSASLESVKPGAATASPRESASSIVEFVAFDVSP